MKKLTKTIFSTILLCLLSNTNISATDNSENDDKIKEIADKSGLPEENIRDDIKSISEKLGITYNEALQNTLLEIREQEVVQTNKVRASWTLPAGAGGNSFYTAAYTSSWNHGHTGVFSSANIIVHAPGVGKKSLEENRSSVKVGSGDQYLSFKNMSSTSTLNAILAKARQLKGLNYSASIDNKTCSGNSAVNCSQLVYCAYLSAGYNVDSNGGMFVSPADIRDSGNFQKYPY